MECPLTSVEAETFWKRDGADRMSRPSLDRIDTGPRKHYTFENCRFIEWDANVRRPFDPKIDESLAEFR